MSSAEAAQVHRMSQRTVQRIPQRVGPSGNVRMPRRPGPQRGTIGSATPPELVELVCAIRCELPGKGHHFCFQLLKRRGHHPPSPVTIWRIWHRARLLLKRKRRQRRRQWAAFDGSPGYFQVDTTYVAGGGFVFAAVETCSRWAFTAWSDNRDSASAARFLRELRTAYPGHLCGVQTDNGAEFAGAFAAACKAQRFPHYLAWVRCPDMNGKVERFIGTMRAESLLGTEDPRLERAALLRDLERHRQFYNCERPHYALGWHTPHECLMLALNQSNQHPP
jgi:hypothetical protein